MESREIACGSAAGRYAQNDDLSQQPCILLVEDYAPNVLVATLFLEQFGYAYEVANNGQEAIEKIKSNRYAAVLMDVQMQGVDGFAATRMTREYEKQYGKTPLPIIGMTAHAMIGDKERCLAAGMDDYIAKPFEPEELRQKLYNAAPLGRRAA